MLGLKKFFSYKFAIALLALSVVSLFYSKRSSISHAGKDAFGVVPIRSISNDSLANETLGFQRIVVLASEDPASPFAWRAKGLDAATTLTGLHINTHRAPVISVAERRKWSLRKGPAQSLSGHIDILQKVVDNNLTTALIIEDDADWDVRIREQLSPSGNIAQALKGFDSEGVQGLTRETEAPYGLDWDVLMLGHCHWNLPAQTELYVDDSTVPHPSRLRALWSHVHYASFPPGKRGIIQSATGLCSFGYGVTQAGAKRIIELNHWNDNFDSIFFSECGNGNLRCNIVAPELIHHQKAEGDTGLRTLIDENITIKKAERFFTMNIQYSARCNAQPDGKGVIRHADSNLVSCPPTDQEFIQFGD